MQLFKDILSSGQDLQDIYSRPAQVFLFWLKHNYWHTLFKFQTEYYPDGSFNWLTYFIYRVKFFLNYPPIKAIEMGYVSFRGRFPLPHNCPRGRTNRLSPLHPNMSGKYAQIMADFA